MFNFALPGTSFYIPSGWQGVEACETFFCRLHNSLNAPGNGSPVAQDAPNLSGDLCQAASLMLSAANENFDDALAGRTLYAEVAATGALAVGATTTFGAYFDSSTGETGYYRSMTGGGGYGAGADLLHVGVGNGPPTPGMVVEFSYSVPSPLPVSAGGTASFQPGGGRSVTGGATMGVGSGTSYFGVGVMRRTICAG